MVISGLLTKSIYRMWNLLNDRYMQVLKGSGFRTTLKCSRIDLILARFTFAWILSKLFNQWKKSQITLSLLSLSLSISLSLSL